MYVRYKSMYGYLYIPEIEKRMQRDAEANLKMIKMVAQATKVLGQMYIPHSLYIHRTHTSNALSVQLLRRKDSTYVISISRRNLFRFTAASTATHTLPAPWKEIAVGANSFGRPFVAQFSSYPNLHE